VKFVAPLTFALVCSTALTGCPQEQKPEPQKEQPKPQAKAAPQAEEKPAPEEPKEARPKRPLNVLLLTVDALRSDMPWTTYDKEIAPNLTELAKESVVYENHRSISSYTAQTVATMMTGQYASTLYRTGNFFTNYFDSNQWITESMQEKAIVTMAVHAHLYFDRAPGLKQGFDHYNMVPGLTWNSQTDESVTSHKSIPEIIKLLSDEKNTKGQFFLWSHLMDPHDQYVKHEESPDFGKDNRGRYDSEVWYTDMWLGKLFEFGKKQPWWDNTAIIISADHGEAFGEHDMYKHAFEVWDCLTRVPLIVKTPGAEPKVIKEGRTHIDLAPTIMELMKLDPHEGFQGKSLVPEIYGEEEPASREPLILELSEDTNNPARRAIIEGDYKLITFESWKKMLFNIKEDPGEEKDLAKDEPEKVKELEAKLKAEFEKLPVIKPFGGNKLRSGKLATGPKGPPKEAADPAAK
jgi:arylsulfatase A-like enzyme